MKTKNQQAIFLCILTIIIGSLIFTHFVKADTNTTVTMTVKISVCGNGIKESGEQCDLNDFGGYGCQNYGFAQGTLNCTQACEVDTSDCTGTLPRGGGGSILPVSATVVFSGSASAYTSVILLKDAQIVATVSVDRHGNFVIPLYNVGAGDYIFSVYGTNAEGQHSALKTFPITVSVDTTIVIDDIVLSSPERGALPEIKADMEKADFDGDGNVNLVDFSMLMYWFNKNDAPVKFDLNGDGKIDLIDFSILAYYWTG